MFQSIIVYGFLGFSLWWLGTIAAKRERINLKKGNDSPFWTWEIVFSLFLFAAISGIRWNVGTDHLGYLGEYQALLSGKDLSRDDFEGGFVFISRLFASLNIHFTLYFAFWALLQLFFVYYTFKNERHILPYLGLILVFGGQYLMWMNGLRQAIAACIFVFSIQYISQRSLIKYISSIFLATLFHQSAIVLIVFYFIPNINYFKNKIISIALLFASIIIGSNPYWLSATDNLSNAIALFGYDEYAENLDYIITERAKEMAFGPRRIITTILNVLIILGFYEFYKKNKSKNILFFFNLSLIGALHYNLFANTGTFFLRPTYYFTIFTPIIASYLLSYYYKSINKGLSLKYIFLFLLSISYLIVAIIADTNKGGKDFTNFKFFWDFM